MEKNSPRVSRKGGGGPTRKSRYAIDEGSEDLIECSGKCCRSCTAGVIADCIALCCCPCALFNLLTLALVKVPWKMGRRCLGLGKKKRNRVEMKRKCKKSCCNEGEDDHNQFGDGNLRERIRVEQEMWEFSTGFGEEEEMGNFSARFEADQRVWLELYQVFDDMDSIYASPEDFKIMKYRDRTRGLHLLQYFVTRCHQIGVACEAWIKKGDEKEVICHEMKRIQPDLLVVGGRGLEPFQRVFVGTASEFCVKHAECPVVTIKRTPDETPQVTGPCG